MGLTRGLMSNKQNDQDPSTILHLGKFSPGAKPNPTIDETTGLTMMIKRAAAESVQQGATPVLPKDGGALPAGEMLGAVSYCYAKGVYTSEEIEQKMLKDKELRDGVHGDIPDAKSIRRFRRLNHGAIQTTLEKAFGFLRRKEKAEIQQPLPGQPAHPQPAQSPGDSTVLLAHKQAEQRLDEAAFIDNMSKE